MSSDTTIVRAAIHPGIGIARVGNSPDEYFIGPEVPYRTAMPAGGYRDASGALKRQAARFRLYGYNVAGEVVKELTADDAQITWVVHVANKKAAWYRFELAMDIPQAVPSRRRNAGFVGAARQQLLIDPGARSISGKNASGARFDTGRFIGQPVYLGELRTDEAGNLLFLGGRGASGTPYRNNPVATFANNEGWHDDIADGPVTADVVINGQHLPVDSAWVIVTPPNYAPDLISLQTMNDLLYDVYQPDWLPLPARPSFTQHIYPTLSQFYDAQWVNLGFQQQFGWGGQYDLFEPGRFARFASHAPENAAERQHFFALLRNPNDPAQQLQTWPQVYGDAAVHGGGVDYRIMLALTKTHYRFLQQWAAGDFDADWNTDASPPPQRLQDVTLAARPATLDKAALYFCMGGPFHPGCEMTWPVRHKTLYSAPYRIRVRQANQPEPDYGPILTPAVLNDPNGPLYLSSPGDITRWLSVPWQADTADCRAGYQPTPNPNLPAFWPARVPNHVLTLENYAQVMNTALPADQRRSAFENRPTWYRVLTGTYPAQLAQMVAHFDNMGIVARRKGPSDGSAFPATIYVETFKPDNLLTLANKTILSESALGAPALISLGDSALALAWTGTDLAHTLSVKLSSDGHAFADTVVLGETSIAGPGFAFGNGRAFLAWTGSDPGHHISVISSTDGRTFGNKVALGETSPYSPALAFGNGLLYLVWAGTNLQHSLCVMSSADGVNFSNKVILSESSGVAPGLSFVDGKLRLLWRGDDANHSLCLMESSDGVTFTNKVVLAQSSDSHPALLRQDQFYLLWTGRDAGRHLSALSAQDDVHNFSDADTFDDSSAAAPAAVTFQGQMYMAWTGTDARGTLSIARLERM